MPRPVVSEWENRLFRKQLNAVLDWLEANGGGASGSGAESFDFDDGNASGGGSFTLDDGKA